MVIETKKENALERFVAQTRELFANETNIDKRWETLRPMLAELMADPSVIEASKDWPDCVLSSSRSARRTFRDHHTLMANWERGRPTSAELLQGHTGTVTCLDRTGDGRACSGSDDGRLILWGLERRRRSQ